MPQTATITSLPAAFEMMKAMQASGVEWGEDSADMDPAGSDRRGFPLSQAIHNASLLPRARQGIAVRAIFCWPSPARVS
jgi:hypothetical protein